MKLKTTLVLTIVGIILFLQACTGGSFHLRKSQDLPLKYQQLQLVDISSDNNFDKVFELAVEESGGQVVDKATTKILFSNIREGKRVVAYNKDRKARIYLLFLKFEYEVSDTNKGKILKKRRINLDRTFVYDANFALGKAEEEDKIRQELYHEAARLILLRLQYSKERFN